MDFYADGMPEFVAGSGDFFHFHLEAECHQSVENQVGNPACLVASFCICVLIQSIKMKLNKLVIN